MKNKKKKTETLKPVYIGTDRWNKNTKKYVCCCLTKLYIMNVMVKAKCIRRNHTNT